MMESKFGYLELSEDDGDGPGHLLAPTFPFRLSGTDRLFFVALTLPKDAAGIIADRSTLQIILKSTVTPQESLANPYLAGSPILQILDQWQRS